MVMLMVLLLLMYVLRSSFFVNHCIRGHGRGHSISIVYKIVVQCIFCVFLQKLRPCDFFRWINMNNLTNHNGTVNKQVVDGDKAGEKIARDREAQRGTVAALSRDIAAVKQREEAASSGSKGKGKGSKGGGSSSGSGGLAQLSETKAAVRVVCSRLGCSRSYMYHSNWRFFGYAQPFLRFVLSIKCGWTLVIFVC